VLFVLDLEGREQLRTEILHVRNRSTFLVSC
jgi:hypothetical protein